MSKYLFLLDIICWGIFSLVWISGGIYNHFKVPVLKRRGSSKTIWPIIIAAVAWSIGKYLPNSYWKFITYDSQWLKTAGAIVLVLATIFTIWSRWTLGRMWASDAVIKEGHRLCTTGPYHLTRHPIYTGITGMLLGSTLRNGFGWVLILSIGVFIYQKIKINNEEKLLIETFGEEYQHYKRCTPQLIPTLKSFCR